MSFFVVTDFPASIEPPEDQSIILPPGAGRQVKGIPFGVTEDTAVELRQLPYLAEIEEAAAYEGMAAAGYGAPVIDEDADSTPVAPTPPTAEEARTLATITTTPPDAEASAAGGPGEPDPSRPDGGTEE